MPDPAKALEGTPPTGGPESWVPPEIDATADSEESPYPYPEVLADWRWLFVEVAAGHLEEYRGHFVAVCDQRIIGSGDDEPSLRQKVAVAHQIDPDRVITMFLDGPE